MCRTKAQIRMSTKSFPARIRVRRLLARVTRRIPVRWSLSPRKIVNVEGPKSSGNSKKSSLKGLMSNDEAIYSAACLAHSNDDQVYIGVGKLNGQPVKVLRDTGCTCTGLTVDRTLIPVSMVIPGSSVSLQMVDHTLIDVLMANVHLDSPYYKDIAK